jgi:hypothetical protein
MPWRTNRHCNVGLHHSRERRKGFTGCSVIDREILQWVLREMTNPACNPAWHFNGIAWDAYLVINDPSEFTGVIAELLRAQGVTATVADAKRTHVISAADLVLWFAEGSIHWHHIDDRDRSLTMTQARAFTLRLLDNPTANAEEIVKALDISAETSANLPD